MSLAFTLTVAFLVLGTVAVLNLLFPEKDPIGSVLDDPVFGQLTYASRGRWEGSRRFGPAGTDVGITVFAHGAGPSEAHHESYQALERRWEKLKSGLGSRVVEGYKEERTKEPDLPELEKVSAVWRQVALDRVLVRSDPGDYGLIYRLLDSEREVESASKQGASKEGPSSLQFVVPIENWELLQPISYGRR